MSKRPPLLTSVIVSTIKNSITGKYVIVEGIDDIVVYRNLITLYQSKGIKVLAAGGRTKVLEVFDALNGTSHLNNAIFIVDQDSWVFSGIPTNYQHDRIICTSGYSIENDVYVDKQIEKLMHGASVYTSFQKDLEIYLKWFALAITRFCIDNNACSEKLDIHPDNFFKTQSITDSYCNLNTGEVFPQQTYDDLLTDYALKFRGKCLLPLAVRSLGQRSGGAKYNSNTIMEETAITGRGVHLNRIFSEVDNLA